MERIPGVLDTNPREDPLTDPGEQGQPIRYRGMLIVSVLRAHSAPADRDGVGGGAGDPAASGRGDRGGKDLLARCQGQNHLA